MIISNRPVETKSDPCAQSYPLIVAYRKADFCEKVSESARELAETCDQILALYQHQPSADAIQNITEHKQYLDDLKIKAMLTGATITIQLKTYDEWMMVVRAGYILDVFTEDGMRAITDRLEKSRDLVIQTVEALSSGAAGPQAKLAEV